MAVVSDQLSNSSGLTSTAAGRPLRVMITCSSSLAIASTSSLNFILASDKEKLGESLAAPIRSGVERRRVAGRSPG